MNNYSELTARTQFILERAAFLRDVWQTLNEEGTPAADVKIQVWLNNAYVPLIVRCIRDNDQATREEALWAVANMLGADSQALRDATLAAFSREILNAVQDFVFLEEKSTVTCAAFLLSNYARFKNMSHAEAASLVPAACAKGVISKGEIAKDLLWAACYAGEKFPTTVPVSLVLNSLGDANLAKEKVRLLRRLLGTVAEQQGLISGGLLAPALQRIAEWLSRAQKDESATEWLWILANIMTEAGAPEELYHNKPLLNTVYNEAISGVGQKSVEAAMVLANYVTNMKNEALQSEVGHDAALRDLFTLLQFSENLGVRKIGEEAMAVLDRYAPPAPAEEEIIYIDDDSTEDDEIFDDEYTEATAPAVPVAPVAPTKPVLAHTAEDISTGTPAKEDWHIRVPCAYELLYGSDRASCESRTVRHLVSLVERAMSDPTVEGDGWVKVPMDTILSVSDLVTLQHMGYVFDGDWLGVNPAIYSGF